MCIVKIVFDVVWLWSVRRDIMNVLFYVFKLEAFFPYMNVYMFTISSGKRQLGVLKAVVSHCT